MQSHQRSPIWFAPTIAFAVGLGALASAFGGVSVIDIAGSCNIKGNISLNTGQKIYHVPGQEHYSETRISTDKGERWFCSEAEARAAGWRRARA